MASLVAASFPELVERCVFIDILGPYTFSPGTSPKRLRASIESRRERGVLVHMVDGMPLSFPCVPHRSFQAKIGKIAGFDQVGIMVRTAQECVKFVESRCGGDAFFVGEKYVAVDGKKLLPVRETRYRAILLRQT